jgi:membrane protein DedA with SNARE-associated domain
MGDLSQSLADITKHGYLVLFTWITAEQLGAPVPAMPILIAAGVLSATGQLSLARALAVGILGCLIGDIAWYGIGRRQGTVVLRVLCKIALEPDTCIRRSSDFISRHGGRALLIAKFIPGVSTVAVPLAANSGISLASFFFHDVLGCALYVGSYLTLGRIVGDRIDKLSTLAQSIRSASVGLAVFAALAIIAWRYQQRRKFQNDLRMARITPEELRDLIERGQHPFIVDLRAAVEVMQDPRVIPGAIHLMPNEVAAQPHEIPRDREVILYCT